MIKPPDIGVLTWVDTWALKSLDVGEIDSHQQCLSLTQQLTQIYQGDFLPSNESNYTLIMRDKQRQCFIKKAVKLGQKLMTFQDKNEVIDFWQQAIEREPHHEEFYFQLSQFFSESGSYSEAKQTYHRCRKLLLDTYNTPPSNAFQEFAEREYL